MPGPVRPRMSEWFVAVALCEPGVVSEHRDLEGQIRQWPDAFGPGIVEGELDTVAIPTKKLAT